MYLINVYVANSKVDGKGVFASEDIAEGNMIWKFETNYDLSVSLAEYESLSSLDKKKLKRIAYLSPTSNKYIYPPINDPALFTNHHDSEYNISAKVDLTISEEPFFVANRNILKGEEIINNYHQFDNAFKDFSTITD